MNTQQSRYPDWHNKPLKLTLDEMANPWLVVQEFFTGYKLPELRELIKSLLLDAHRSEEVSGTDYITFCEDVEKLAEAAWLLQQENAHTSYKNVERPALKAIIDLFVLALQPDRIFLLQDSPVDLLIVLPESCQKPFTEYQLLIEAFTVNEPGFSFSLHKSAEMNKYLVSGHPLYCFLCTPASLVYNSRKSSFPETPQNISEELKAKVNSDFEPGMSRAASFLDGARTYADKGETSVAAFMIQQSVELAFRAVILALSGYDARVHSIKELKKQCRRVAPALNQLLPGGSHQEERLLALLEKAYLNGRYADNFEIDVPDLKLLLERAEIMQAAAREIFEEKMAMFANP